MSIEEVRPQISEALYRGNRVEAIKLYRAAAACDLTEAKRSVEVMEQALRKLHPERFPARAPVDAAIGLRIAAILVALIVLLYVLLR